MKSYSLIKAILSIFFIATAINLDAVCISIDRFKAPCGVNIYLFGDMHVGDTALITEEQNAFLAAAKEKDAFCIVEDMANYTGDNHHISSYVQDTNASRMQNIDEVSRGVRPDAITKMATALHGLADRCTVLGIPHFNAECRQASCLACEKDNDSYKYDAELLSMEADRLIKDISFIANSAKEGDKEDPLRDFYDRYLSSFLDLGRAKDPVQLACGPGSFAVDIQIISQIHNLLLKYRDVKDEDKRDIFIFVGGEHIRRIIPALEWNLRCVELPLHGQEDSSLDSQKLLAAGNDIMRLSINFKPDAHNAAMQDQALAREYINKHKVDIAEFFKSEKQSERAFTGIQAASREETGSEIRARMSLVGRKRMDENFLTAVCRNDINTAIKAIDRGADVNCVNQKNYSALMQALLCGHTGMVRLLLDRGADVNARVGSGDTALRSAVLMEKFEVAKILLEHNAEVNMVVDQYGTTLLMELARCNNAEMVEMFIARGANINAVSEYGATALSLARDRHHHNVTKLLIDAGATR